MIIRNITADIIGQSAADIGVRVENLRPANKAGTAYRFVIRPKPAPKLPAWKYGKYYRRGFIKRTVSAVCWHGHRDFFRRIFELAPLARVQTRQTADLNFRWYTAENFEDVYNGTDTNIGSQYRPMMFSDACFCKESGYADRSVPFPSTGIPGYFQK